MKTGQPHLSWHVSRIRRCIKQKICSTFYRDRHPDVRNSILVAGTARSGTTWLADLIASQIPCRILFEPFQAEKVEAFRPFHYFHYMPPEEEDSRLQAYCQKIFTGDIRHPWIDRQVEHLFPAYRLIKEIRANLFLRWIHDRFPEVPLLFIIRHPCAVVLSRMRLHWATDRDIQPFLAQPALIEDFLSDKMDVIDRSRTPEEKHAVIWCVSNLVPLRQFDAGRLPVVFYEHLCTQPEIEIPRIFEAIGHTFRDSAFDQVHQPSTTAVRTSAIVTGRDQVSQWREMLSPDQIRNILSVVRQFGLDELYGDSLTPSCNLACMV